MRVSKKGIGLLILIMLCNILPLNLHAASTNGLAKGVIKVGAHYIFKDKTTANAVKITFKDNCGDDEIFYLELKGATWNENALTYAFGEDFITEGKPTWVYEATGGAAYGNAVVKYIKQSDTCMKVWVDGGTIKEKGRYTFPLLVEMEDETATVSLKHGTTTTSGKWTFAKVVEQQASWLLGTVNTIGTSGKLADFKIVESYRGAMSNRETRVSLELDNPEYVFDISGEQVDSEYDQYGYTTYKITGKDNVEFLSGFYNKGSHVYILVHNNDKGCIDIIVPSIQGGTTAGTVIIKNLYAKTKEMNGTTGNLLVNISSDDLSNAKDGVTIAKIETYGTYIAMTTTKATDIPAGHIEDISFIIGEKVDNSLIGNRTLTMRLDSAQFDYRTLLGKYGNTGKTEAQIKEMTNEEVLALNPQLDIDKLKKDKHIQLVNNITLITDIAFAQDIDNKIDPSSLVVTIAKGIESNNKVDRVTMKLPVYVPIANRKLGSSGLIIEGPAAEDTAVTQAVTIKDPLKITVDPLVLKGALQDQVGGKITITEANKGMLQNGEIIFKLTEEYEGIYIKGNSMDIHTEGGLKGLRQSTSEDDCFLAILTRKESKQAGSIVIQMNKITIDNTVPQGSIDIEIGGTAIDAYGESLTIEDFLKIETTDLEQETDTGIGKEVVKFTIGTNKYNIGTKTIQMDVTPYIQTPGYTMVPIRYVAQAFGLQEKDILYDKAKNTITLLARERIIQLTKGSKQVTVNTIPMEIAVPVIIKEGRTFVSVSEIARLLSLKSTWDNQTKIATFQRGTGL